PLPQQPRQLGCTENMARGNGSTFQGTLPIAKKYNVGAINWGLVAGKTQTFLPWDSWQHPYTDREPSVWFHEVFRADGTPYRQEEVELIKKLTMNARADAGEQWPAPFAVALSVSSPKYFAFPQVP